MTVETYEFSPAGRTQDRNIELEAGDVIELTLVKGGTIGKNPVGRPRKVLDIARAKALYVDEVLPLATVAATLGVATLTLRKRFEAEGVAVRGRGRPVHGAANIAAGVLELASAKERAELKARCAAALEASEATEDEVEETDEA